MNPEAAQNISLAGAIDMIAPLLVRKMDTLKSVGADLAAPRWQHAVMLASQISLSILDTLAPGHPGLAAVDVMGHALTGIFQQTPVIAGPTE